MIPLPFTLKVPSQDHSTAESTAWSTDALRGLLHFDGERLGIEWTGTSSIDEVSGLEVHSQSVTLPLEYHEVPLTRIRTAGLTGGWWRPRLELTANELEAFLPIPGQAAGRVAFRIARRDRALASQLVTALRAAARPDPDDGLGRVPNG